MVAYRKAQGLSIQTIVIFIIAITVLFIVMLFATGNFAKLFGRTKDVVDTTSDTNLVAIQTKCMQYCMKAQQIDFDSQWTNTQYCMYTYEYDGETKHCWNEPVNELCEVKVKNSEGADTVCSPKEAGECRATDCDTIV